MKLFRTGPRLAVFAVASLLMLSAAGCSEDGSDRTAQPSTSTTIGPAATTTDQSSNTPTSDVSDVTKEDIQFRPVLATERCGDLEARETAPGEDVLREDGLPENDDATCYLVGPAGGDGTDIEAARAISEDDTWFVMVTVKESSRESINELFNSCYQGDPTCPFSGSNPGVVAIIVDDIVLSAPGVRAKNVADEAFTISTDFSEEEAEQLAQVLTG